MDTKQVKNLCFAEERILIQAHRSSADLKEEIRRCMQEYCQMEWELVKISNDNSFIYLRFKQIC